MTLTRGMLLLSLLAAAPLRAVELETLMHTDLRGGLAAVAGQQQTYLLQGEVFAVPAMRFSEATSLTPSFYFLGGGQERSLEETALFVETASMGFRPQLKFRQTDGSAWALRGDVRHAFNVQAVNETLGSGRYDYEDLSAGMGWDGQAAGVPFGIGLDASHRGYPNYHNLASEQFGGKDYYLKDHLGYKGEAHADVAPLGRLSGSLQMLNYTDAYVVDATTGQVDTGKPQQDLLFDVGLRGARPMDGEGRLVLGWTLDWQGNMSNQNTFDTAQAVGQAHGEDYVAYAAGISSQWRPGAGAWALQGGYTANFRNFDRQIQNVDGSYALGNIAEVEHDLNLGFNAPFAKSFAVVGGADARILLSNQQYAAAGIPSYTYFGINLGLAWDWKPAE